MRNLLGTLFGKKESASTPAPDRIRDLIFLPAMSRFDAVDPAPSQKHFLKAFAFALGFETAAAVKGLLLDPAISDWAEVGASGPPSAVVSFGSFLGLRLAHLACDDLREGSSGEDQPNEKMLDDMWYIATQMFGQDAAALNAFEERQKLENEMTDGTRGFNATQLMTGEMQALDRLLGIEPPDPFKSVDAFQTNFTKSAHVTGQIVEARANFFKSVDQYLGS
jgi:hypothetical protein